MTPGPTPVPAEVRAAQARSILHHRTPEFQAILKEVAEGLKKLFGTAQDVFILASSGTGAMEAAVVNLLLRGDKAIVIRGGKFGQRWAEICESYGVAVIPADPQWGRPLDPQVISRLLKQHPDTKAVFATLCETSTGVAYDPQTIRQAMGTCAALLVVDAVSGLLAEPFSMDAFGVDVTVCGSQKGFMLPPGLAFIALSQRAWEAVFKAKAPSYYFNLRLAKKAWEKTDTPFTPAISLIVALSESLKLIEKKGLDQILHAHRENAIKIREAVCGMGLELYADVSCAANGVTAVKVPPTVSGKDLVKKIRDQHGISIAGGQGKELEGKIFRIASMGAIGWGEIEKGLKAIEQVLSELGWKPKGVCHA